MNCTVLERAAEEGILHRDCSLNNVAIEDLQSGSSRGLLLDWEFGVEVKEDHRYGLGGTVSRIKRTCAVDSDYLECSGDASFHVNKTTLTNQSNLPKQSFVVNLYPKKCFHHTRIC